MRAELSVGEVAHRTGVAVSALHFYERKGLIRSERTAGNHRVYPRSVIRRVSVIKVAQKAGIPLTEIAAVFATVPGDRPLSADDWATISTAWRDDLARRITLLSGLRDDLSGCIGCGCLSLEACPLFNANDALAEKGPGAHRLPRPQRN